MNEIIPAILPENINDLKEKISALPTEITFIHLDVLEEDIWTPIDRDFEAHLMVEEPEKIIERWVSRGAKRIIAHKFINTRGAEFGLAFEMKDPIENAEKVDFVHLMSIDEIGEQGHAFDLKVFDRIREVRERFPKVKISVDGGISAENYQELIEAGADRLIVGSHFKDLWSRTK